MPPIKLQLNLTYGLEEMLTEDFQDGHNGGHRGISEWTDFSNSESLCRSNASHPVLAQSDLWFGRRCCLKNFKMAAQDIRTEQL